MRKFQINFLVKNAGLKRIFWFIVKDILQQQEVLKIKKLSLLT